MKNNRNESGKQNKPESIQDNPVKSGNKSTKLNYKIISILLIALMVVCGAGMYYYFNTIRAEQISTLTNNNESLASALLGRDSLINQRDSLIADWIYTFNEIQENVNLIRGKQQMLEVKSNSIEFSTDKKKEIIADLKYINTLVESNKKKIRYLNERLKNSGVKIAALEENIKELQNTMELRDSSINELKSKLAEKNFQMAQMNEVITGMMDELNGKTSLIDKQTKELNKAYVAAGTMQELEEKDVLEKKKGLFTWINNKATLSRNLSQNSFTEVNIMNTRTIPVHSKKAELLTYHPKDSYDFVKDSNKMIAYLEIKNPEEFWKVSKYAVLEIKGTTQR